MNVLAVSFQRPLLSRSDIILKLPVPNNHRRIQNSTMNEVHSGGSRNFPKGAKSGSAGGRMKSPGEVQGKAPIGDLGDELSYSYRLKQTVKLVFNFVENLGFNVGRVQQDYKLSVYNICS